MQPSDAPRIGYVLKIYPRFSETFIVTEILAREAAGEQLEIFSLRPPVDPRFHPELARVQAPVTYITRPHKLSEAWPIVAAAQRGIPGFQGKFARLLPELVDSDPGEVHQGIELATLLTQRGITHMHAHFGSIAARTAHIASAITGIPFSFTAHAKDIFHELVDPEQLERLLAGAHHTVTVSDYNLDFLSAFSPENAAGIHRVYNGLELGRFPYRAPTAPHAPLRIAAVGRLVEKKGFPLLIDAVADLGRQGIPVELRIAGGGELQQDLDQQVRSLGLSPTVTLLGPRTQSEVVELLRWADVFAAPCVVGADGNADGLPTVLLEAMAIGVPCIGSDVTGIPEVLKGGTGLLVRAGVVSDLVDALRTTASPAFDRAGVTRAARSLIEGNFDARNQSTRLRELCTGEHALSGAAPVHEQVAS
ncbi:glycosyltransferase family 4 protein [Arthrobacter sp. H5]|uniref:glycosyltransferase family 4 protein n=1 Tax=Arthrobacter sp. H5 TaxID=1267973 RepID=UPI0004B849BA|nr:glycosyltransferase family 4 protein [Arthrobacter sp. H5]